MNVAAYLVTALLGGAGVVVGVKGMLGSAWTVHVSWLVPLGGLELRMDTLAGFFVALVGSAVIPVSIYAMGYDPHERRGIAAYVAFVAAMLLVPLAANTMTFAISWELMSLASYILVVRPRTGHAAHAGWVYAVMTHAGLGCLLAGMLLLGAWTGSARFADWVAAAPALDAAARSLAWTLLAVGFLSKAGAIPLHVWLPLAHPAAPSHVSALMSGVMIKLGIYGLIRASFDWLGTGPVWWGTTLLLLGAVTAVGGVLYALADRDLKRLLAYSSIENVGIILIGLGAALAFRATGEAALALLSLTAALYHVLNHAAFKSLLFMAAGSVLRATGTRDLEALGGLVKRMPWTAAAFFVGSVAIAALPPLNGFASEWLTFQALLQNVRVPLPYLNLIFTVAIAALALTGGLAVACFVRAYGIAFLAMPRSNAAAAAQDAPASMRTAMLLATTACVVLGLGATAIADALGMVAATVAPAADPIVAADWLTLQVSDGFASMSTALVAVVFAVALIVPSVMLTIARARVEPRRYETWNCGRLLHTARMQYTATAFSNPFTRVFDFFYRPAKRLEVHAHPESRLFVLGIEYANPTRFVVDEWVYRPVNRAVQAVARRAIAIQSGSPNLYLTYVLAVLLLLLVLA